MADFLLSSLSSSFLFIASVYFPFDAVDLCVCRATVEQYRVGSIDLRMELIFICVQISTRKTKQVYKQHMQLTTGESASASSGDINITITMFASNTEYFVCCQRFSIFTKKSNFGKRRNRSINHLTDLKSVNSVQNKMKNAKTDKTFFYT